MQEVVTATSAIDGVLRRRFGAERVQSRLDSSIDFRTKLSVEGLTSEEGELIRAVLEGVSALQECKVAQHTQGGFRVQFVDGTDRMAMVSVSGIRLPSSEKTTLMVTIDEIV